MTENLLATLYNACDPSTAAAHKYYVDTNSARGSGLLITEFQQRLRLKNETGYLCLLFSGHLGCGKSSELNHLSEKLNEGDAENERYFTISVNANDYLNPAQVSVAEILLAIISELADRTQAELGINILKSDTKGPSLLERPLKEIQFLSSHIVPEHFRSRVRSLPKEPEEQESVRQILKQRMEPLLDQINLGLQMARSKLKQKGYRDIVIIIDNLEKLNEVGALFMSNQPQLGGLSAHVIYTIPLNVARGNATTLESLYGSGSPCVLPMVKVCERQDRNKIYQKGQDCLKNLVQKRIYPTALNTVFSDGVLEYLILFSGGNVRQLMTSIQAACTYNRRNEPISMVAAKQSIGKLAEHYSTSILEEHWEKLIDLERSPDQKYPVGDESYLHMLNNLTVLEYRNGVADEDEFATAEPWYAVHPVVRRMPRFKKLIQITAAGPIVGR